jgi:hypothetical protein
MGIELKRIKICKCTSEVDAVLNAEFNTLAGLHMSLVVVFFRVRLFLCLKNINFKINFFKKYIYYFNIFLKNYLKKQPLPYFQKFSNIKKHRPV